MTNKEAIEFLKNMCMEKAVCAMGKEGFAFELMQYHTQALHLAIKALEERFKGEWIFRSGVTCGGYYKCSNCGEVERAEKNFCPNCGADMMEE